MHVESPEVRSKHKFPHKEPPSMEAVKNKKEHDLQKLRSKTAAAEKDASGDGAINMEAAHPDHL